MKTMMAIMFPVLLLTASGCKKEVPTPVIEEATGTMSSIDTTGTAPLEPATGATTTQTTTIEPATLETSSQPPAPASSRRRRKH